MENLKGLVLSGGRGTRLRPITHTNAKQLVPVANKPVLFYGLEAMADAGIREDGITELVETFKRSEPDALILLTHVPDPEHYGVAELNGDRVKRLVEKPEHPPSDLALVGVYMFTPVIFDAARAIEPSWRDELEIT